MIKLTKRIVPEWTFLRVDFYEIGRHSYFCEAAFYSTSGIGRISPSDADNEIGKLLKLPI